MITRRMFLGSMLTTFAAGCFPRRTEIPAQTQGDLRLVFFTDIHTCLERGVPDKLSLAARAINSVSADLLIGGGDFITGGLEASSEVLRPRWELYRSFHSSLQGIFYPVIGNHDLVAVRPRDGSEPSRDPRSEFRKFFRVEKTCYSFNAAGLHFIVLDSVVLDGSKRIYHGEIPPEQILWLHSDLMQVNAETPIVLVTHLPLLSVFFQATIGPSPAAPANRIITNNREVLSLFEGHNLLLVLQGHLHVNELIRWRNTTFITGGAVCGKWWQGSWHATPEGFGVVNLRRGKVEWDYRDYALPQTPTRFRP